MKKNITLCFIIICIISCSHTKVVNVNQTESKTSVIIRRSDTMAVITIPLSFDISKNTNKQILASGCIYLSSKGWHCNTSFTSKKTNDILTVIGDSHKSRALTKLTQEHYIDVRISNHDYFDTLKTAKKILDPYIAKMKLKNQDSLNLGTVRELKITNPELLEDLLKGDSIILDFYYDKLYHPIILPVEIK